MPLRPFFIAAPGAALTSDLCEASRLQLGLTRVWNGADEVCVSSLQEQNSALALENENQREQYERCLDEVSDTFPVR